MATNLTFSTSQTNQTPKSCHSEKCTCNTFWSILQQTSYIKLSNKTGNNQYRLEVWYEQRARRIAAIYARIYLEMEKELGGNPNLKGRFYWMGLGAFASKTVAATFDSWITRTGYQGNKIILNYPDAPKSVHIFAKGNLWLFMDVAPWHWAWALSPSSFEQCKTSRNASNYVAPVKKALNALPWASTALPGVKGFKLTNEIREAFKYLPDIESLKPYSGKALKLQILHLKAIAIQEQKNILQNICWNHKWMRSGAEAQRFWGRPKTFIRFHSSYEEEMNGLIGKSDKDRYNLREDPFSYAPKYMKAEKYDSRMEWILDVADKYHRLMSTDSGRNYIERHLRIIATWANSTKKGKTDGYSNDPQGNQ
ncbi:DUF2515 family protein [Neisseria sicca]|uniref:DUF2515 family protein n=1 Tax=Neisseria sicca TaxID=490 RepID=UPI00080A93F2|nr:hypothetical protein [Neisseria sicca]